SHRALSEHKTLSISWSHYPIYLTGIFMTWRRARGFIKQEKVVLAE
ncbi:hypothetical protein, partial [Escherichia coli]